MAESFVATEWRRRPGDGVLEFAFTCSRYGDFVETIAFPGAAAKADLDKAAGRLAGLLHAALGVSYYKAAAAPSIELRTLTPGPAGEALIAALYRDGLGEFFVRNALPYPPRQTLAFTGPSMGAPAKAQPRPRGRAVLAFGGGKDSHVALELAEGSGWTAELAAAALSDRIARAIGAMAPRALTVIKRTLDPRLIEANKAGALNGHVPVTAINSLILLLYAHLSGAAHVVFANERSADEATLEADGHAVNHQFSKTLAVERLIREAAAEAGTGVEYFSLLRPFSELWIARRLVASPNALQLFRSCNANFVSADDAAPARPWCGACAKCAFTALMTAPFMSRAASRALFGSDVLDAPAAVEHLAGTAGLSGPRPWDCVGTADETAAAIHRLSQEPDWADARAIAELAPQAALARGPHALDAAWRAAFVCEGAHFLPPEFVSLCDDDAHA